MNCPHCGISIFILQLNCRIFRCGVYKSNGMQIPPHLPKVKCDDLVRKDAIWGCGKPFKYINGRLVKCGYV